MNRINPNCLKQLYLTSDSLFNQRVDSLFNQRVGAVQILLIKLKHWIMWKSDLEKPFKSYFLYEYQGHIKKVNMTWYYDVNYDSAEMYDNDNSKQRKWKLEIEKILLR